MLNHMDVKVKPYGCDKMYKHKDLIEDRLYQLKDQLSQRRKKD